jgi:hypothetical protein
VCRRLGGKKGDAVRAGDYNNNKKKRNENNQLGTGFFTPQNNVSS